MVRPIFPYLAATSPNTLFQTLEFCWAVEEKDLMTWNDDEVDSYDLHLTHLSRADTIAPILIVLAVHARRICCLGEEETVSCTRRRGRGDGLIGSWTRSGTLSIHISSALLFVSFLSFESSLPGRPWAPPALLSMIDTLSYPTLQSSDTTMAYINDLCETKRCRTSWRKQPQ